MTRYILRRVWYMFITLFIIASASFFLMKMLPGSPLKADDKLTEEQKAIVLEKYGLNDPVPVQYVKYLGGLAQGDLGISFTFDSTPVTKILMDQNRSFCTIRCSSIINWYNIRYLARISGLYLPK